MSTSNVERWKEDAHAFREIWKSINLEDDASVWDAAMKQSVLAKVLAKDAFKLEAIDARYLEIFNEQMKYIDMHWNSLRNNEQLQIREI